MKVKYFIETLRRIKMIIRIERIKNLKKKNYCKIFVIHSSHIIYKKKQFY